MLGLHRYLAQIRLACRGGLPLLRLNQDLNQLIECRVGALIDFFRLHRADGMLYYQHRMIRRAESFAFRFCQRLESVRDYCNCEPAAFL
jgi:hypothetical protein